MGRWNPRRDRDPDKKDEVAFKEFLISKYERKHWYVSPAELKKETKESPKPEPKLQPPPSSKVCSGMTLWGGGGGGGGGGGYLK